MRTVPLEIDEDLGRDMHRWASDLFHYPRSLSGPGVTATFEYLDQLFDNLTIHRVATGTQAFDWTVPDEWTLRDAYIENSAGERIVDFKQHNLHVVGYSEPVDTYLTLEDLQKHLYSLPDQPDAIPYVTSYYKRRWGFCLTDRQRKALVNDTYHVVVDADLGPGHISYGEVIIPGTEKSEVMLSTYICHPSMANNELSGPAVTAALIRWLQSETRRHTYRITFVPETIGSIIYLSQHASHLKKHLRAGFVLTCIGDDRTYSLMPSRRGDTLADRIALGCLKGAGLSYDHYSFLERGSDERQYCSPLIDLPFVSIMRSMYGKYPEYHTSLDDLNVISPQGLAGGFALMQKCLKTLEAFHTYKAAIPCEPQLGKRGLYPDLSIFGSAAEARRLTNVLAYADGNLDLIDLANTIEDDVLAVAEIAENLCGHNLLVRV
jgi:aminopeptidase-like protein